MKPMNLMDKDDGLDEYSSRSRICHVLAHAFRQAREDGLTLIEAQALWNRCAESGFFPPETWDRYQPEILR